MPALFERLSDDVVLATGYSRGPWSPNSLHGGPVAILVAGEIEALPTDAPMMVSRITLELERPVPLTPLRISTTISRPGRKVRVIDVELHTVDTDGVAGVRVARARALQQRLAPVSLPNGAELIELLASEPPPAGPDGLETGRSTWGAAQTAYHADSMVSRFVEGSWDDPGPVVVWVQLVVDVFEGVGPSPLQRVCAAADFGNGISAVLSWDDYLYINPDLTIHLVRPAVGQWVAMSTKSHFSELGTGMAESELFDVDGRVGRSVQSLFIDTV